MKHPTHKSLNTAYAFYYATDAAPPPAAGGKDSPEVKARLAERLNALMKDCLIVAKAVSSFP
jgi:glycylpeptide N-tetradecanoyltransferase